MPTREQVARWRALADAGAEPDDVDELNRQAALGWTAREAVPAMASALLEAAHIIDALLGTGRGNSAEAEAVAWLAKWRGDAPGGGDA